MTKDEIKKALEFCDRDDYFFCGGCAYDNVRNCTDKLKIDALNLIIEQEKEIERLKDEKKQVQIDVLNEAKEKLDSAPNGWAYTGYIDDRIEEVKNEG